MGCKSSKVGEINQLTNNPYDHFQPATLLVGCCVCFFFRLDWALTSPKLETAARIDLPKSSEFIFGPKLENTDLLNDAF